MKVPFLDLNTLHQQIKAEVFAKLNDMYDRCEFVYGGTAKKFEESFANYNQTKYALAVDNGTTAVELALRSAGIKAGDEVISVANTFCATIAGIYHLGATPVFVEIDPDTLNMDPSCIEEKITTKTKAILPVHLYGQPADMIRIREIAKKHNLLLIGDSAQSIGSRINEDGEWKSTSSFADISTFSFYPGKNLGACGEGGAIVTNNDTFADYIDLFRKHGERERYIHEIVGRNNRMDGFQAAILSIKMKYIEDWNVRRRQVAQWYIEGLKDVEQIKITKVLDHHYAVYHIFVIQVDQREKLMKYLDEQEIGTALHYKLPLHLQKAFASLGYKPGDLPITEKAVASNMSLPMDPNLTYNQVSYVCQKIRDYYKI